MRWCVLACGVRAGVLGLRKVGGIGIASAFGRSGSGQSVRRHGSDKLRHATGLDVGDLRTWA